MERLSEAKKTRPRRRVSVSSSRRPIPSARRGACSRGRAVCARTRPEPWSSPHPWRRLASRSWTRRAHADQGRLGDAKRVRRALGSEGHLARRTSRSALPGRARRGAETRERNSRASAGVTMSAMSLPPALDRRDPPRPPRGRVRQWSVMSSDRSFSRGKLASHTPCAPRCAQDARGGAHASPYRARASPRCAARATTRAPAAVTPRPAAASTVAFDSRVARVARCVPVGRRERRGAIAHPASHHRARLHGHRRRRGRGGRRLDGHLPSTRWRARSPWDMAATFVAYYLGARDPTRFARCARFTASPASLAPPCVAYGDPARGVLVAGHAEPDDARQPRIGPESREPSTRSCSRPSLAGISTLLARQRRRRRRGCTSRASTCSSRGTRRCARRAGHARAGVRVRARRAVQPHRGVREAVKGGGRRRRLLRRAHGAMYGYAYGHEVRRRPGRQRPPTNPSHALVRRRDPLF